MSGKSADDRRLVALETTARVGSVAVGTGPEPARQRSFSSGRRHAVELLPVIIELCGELGWSPAAVTDLAISAGPGSFTGLRVGYAVARSWRHFGPVRVWPVPTLEVVAANVLPQRPGQAALVPMLDAKRGQVYGAICRSLPSGPRLLRTEFGPGVYDPQQLLSRVASPFIALGEALGFVSGLAEAVAQAGGRVAEANMWPAAAGWVYRLACRNILPAKEIAESALVPVYIRPPEAEERWRAAHGK